MVSAQSSDEGEIIESVEDLKTIAPRASGRNGVDRQDRPRTPVKSPGYDRPQGAYGRDSHSPRGYKRPRDDRDYRDQNGSQGGDTRRFRVHYEDDRGGHRRPRASYHDLDRPTGPANPYSGRYRDTDRDRDRSRDRYSDRSDRSRNVYPEKRQRTRSRSPYRRDSRRGDRYGRGDGRFDRHGSSPKTIKYDDHLDRDSRTGPVSRRAGQEEAPRSPRNEAKPDKGPADERQQSRKDDASRPNQSTDEDSKVEESFDASPVDEDAEIERRRKRREAILAKSNSATPLLIHALHSSDKASSVASPADSSPSSAAQRDEGTPQPGNGAQMHKESSANPSDVTSPASTGDSDDQRLGGMAIADDQDLINTHGKASGDEEDGPSAADYDPTIDMREDGLKDEKRHGNVGLHGEWGGPPMGEAVAGGAQSDKQGHVGSDDDDDDDFNMFADDFDVDKYAAVKSRKTGGEGDADADASGPGGGLLEDADKDGYYKLRIGEVLNGRYQVQTTLGKGMFSGVVRAVDTTNNKLVAIKMMRNNDALRKGGFTEIAILQKLNESDPEGRKHIVKFWHHFDHKGHLCMAFENLSLNLREVLKKFGNNVGINLNATRAYAHQIFIALAHLRKSGIIHADLKPDNILVNESRNTLKICDLGTAIDRQDAATAHNEITPYLVSRFYRAPEIMLGMPYDYSIDMWSIGCTLYELYTGKILFTGDSNNQMLKSIMEIRGKMPPKTYRKGELAAMHFDEKGNFVSVERDKVLGKTTIKTYAVIKPTRDLRMRLLGASTGMDDAETKDLNLFVDLLEQCLALNPDKRMKPAEALKHPFFTTRGPVRK